MGASESQKMGLSIGGQSPDQSLKNFTRIDRGPPRSIKLEEYRSRTLFPFGQDKMFRFIVSSNFFQAFDIFRAGPSCRAPFYLNEYDFKKISSFKTRRIYLMILSNCNQVHYPARFTTAWTIK